MTRGWMNDNRFFISGWSIATVLLNQGFSPWCVLCAGWQPSLLKFKENEVCLCEYVCIIPGQAHRLTGYLNGLEDNLVCVTTSRRFLAQRRLITQHDNMSPAFLSSSLSPRTHQTPPLDKDSQKEEKNCLMTACFICLFTSILLSIQHCRFL